VSETDSEPKTKGDVYRERNILALAFLLEAHRRGQRVGWWPDTDDVNGEEWAVVWGERDEGQVGWHVPTSLVPDWLPKRNPHYDGYTTTEKNARVCRHASLPPFDD
jgi:hypothetical protein